MIRGCDDEVLRGEREEGKKRRRSKLYSRGLQQYNGRRDREIELELDPHSHRTKYDDDH